MRLFHNLVLLKPEAVQDKKDGIFLTGNSLRELPPYGEVLAVAPSVIDLKVGDRVSYAVYAGVDVEDDNVIVPFDSIFGVDDAKTH